MKQKLYYYLLLIVAISGCHSANTTEKTDGKMEKFVQQYFQYFNQHNWQQLSNLYADTAYFKDPSLGKTAITQTRQQTIDKYTGLQKMFPNIHDSVISIYATKSNNVIVEFISTGKAADKTEFSLPICTIFTIENGLITKDYTYYDNF